MCTSALQLLHSSVSIVASSLLATEIVSDGLKPVLPHSSLLIFLVEDVFSRCFLSLGLIFVFYNNTNEYLTTGCLFPVGKVEMDKYRKAINWLRDLLYNVQFTEERLKIVASKMVNDVARMKRDGRTVVQTIMREINYSKGISTMLSAMPLLRLRLCQS